MGNGWRVGHAAGFKRAFAEFWIKGHTLVTRVKKYKRIGDSDEFIDDGLYWYASWPDLLWVSGDYLN